MNLRNAMKLVCALSAFVAVGAHATIINYSFTATGGHAGTFSYDDTAVTIGNGPYAPGAVAYSALSLFIDGTSIVSPELVIYQNYNGNQFAYFTSAAGFPNYVQLANTGTGLFTSSAASQMDNRTLASFDGIEGDNQLFTATGGFALTSLSSGRAAVTVPEPEVLVLMLAGAAGLAVGRRRKR